MESIDSPQNPTPRLKVVPPNQIKPTTSSPAASKLPIPAQLPTQPITQPETTLPISHGGGSGGSGGSQTMQGNAKKIPHTLIMVGTIAAVLIGIGLIPWEYNINGNGKVEPDSNEEENISLPAGHFLERLYQESQFRKGETIATTIDLQQEDKLREIRQNIIDAQAQKNTAEKELDVARRQLQEAEANVNIAESRVVKSRDKINSSSALTLVDREIEIKLRERDNLLNELQVQQRDQVRWEKLIADGVLGFASPQVMNTDSEIRRLTSRLNTVEGEFLQVQSKRIVTQDQLIEDSQEEIDRSQKENFAFSTSKERFNQAIQRVRDTEARLQQLQTREKELLTDQEKQTTHVAPFDGVADFTDVKKYRNQRLTEPVKIRFYNPENMLVRIKVTQLDYCRINEGMPVSFIPYGKEEVMGTVESKATKGEPEVGNPNTLLFSVWVRINSSDGDQKITLDNDMMGKTSIKVGSERIYQIVGGEIYKLFNPLQSSFSYCE
ncbi:MAG: hypothetical protein HC916_06245 [Coleofasciculaceae cyanobacterium SM2_1_6]|nr:hypothetical protein [Coleofasciculaceae cyanobacterium SM2_1_6]